MSLVCCACSACCLQLGGLLAGGATPTELVRSQLSEQGHSVVSWEEWLAIEATETAQGELNGKLSSPPREKIVHVDEMLAIAHPK